MNLKPLNEWFASNWIPVHVFAQRTLGPSFYRKRIWYVENVSFCLNNPEICDKLPCLREVYCEILWKYYKLTIGRNREEITQKSLLSSAPSCDHFGRHGEWKKCLATKFWRKSPIGDQQVTCCVKEKLTWKIINNRTNLIVNAAASPAGLKITAA